MKSKWHVVLSGLMMVAGIGGMYAGKGSYRGAPVEGFQVRAVGALIFGLGCWLLFSVVRARKKKESDQANAVGKS